MKSLVTKLCSFHRRCLRQIFGCVIHNGRVMHARSRRRTNHSALCLRFKMPELPDIILKRRLTWLGRMTRLPDTDPQRKLLDARTPYPPFPGRKRTPLPQSYVNNLTTAGIKLESWLQLAQDKNAWTANLRPLASLKPTTTVAPST